MRFAVPACRGARARLCANARIVSRMSRLLVGQQHHVGSGSVAARVGRLMRKHAGDHQRAAGEHGRLVERLAQQQHASARRTTGTRLMNTDSARGADRPHAAIEEQEARARSRRGQEGTARPRARRDAPARRPRRSRRESASTPCPRAPTTSSTRSSTCSGQRGAPTSEYAAHDTGQPKG